MELVNHAQRRLSEKLGQLDPQEQWNEVEDLRHSFMNVVIAAAKRFEIEPFLSMDVPRLDGYKNDDHRQFKADLDHYITQLMLDNSMQSKRDSVGLLSNSKDRIRKYILALRECIEKSNMTDAKKDALLNKLEQFEKELEKRRISILAVSRLTLELLALPGGVWGSVDVAHKLITNVMQTVAEAQAVEQETRQLPSSNNPKALSPPRAEKELDDSIPF
jgi:hypothetical protein